jgi:hypothetical protein
MIEYKLFDTIKYKREGYTEPIIGYVYELHPKCCFVQSTFPQYNIPINVMVRDTDIVGVVKPN